MGDVRQDETLAHEALREALCNCLIHCQYRMLEDLLMTCGRNLKSNRLRYFLYICASRTYTPALGIIKVNFASALAF